MRVEGETDKEMEKNLDANHLKKLLKQILKKCLGAGCDVDPSVANLLALNLPHTITPVQIKSFLEEIDQQGEFPTREEAQKFLDLLGILFFGIEFHASPQVEDGFTRIANEIMEALARIRIPGEARQPLDFVLRKTYGFGKKEDKIALSQIVLGTGLKKPNVCRAIGKLLEMNLVIVKDNGNVKIYRFQKDYSKWKPLSKKITLSKAIIKGPKSLSKAITTIERVKRKYYVEGSDELRLASLLLEEIKKNQPTFKQPNFQIWAKEIDLMIHRDGRTPERIEEVIRWCQTDGFWRRNVLSPLKLRKQFDRLEAEMASPKGRVSPREMPRVEYRDLTGGGRA
jgi:phage replication O-like protein O